MAQIEVFTEGITLPYGDVTRQKVKNIAAAVADCLDLQNARITIILTGDAYIRTINSEYRSIDAPTDVISFANRDNPFPDIDASQEEIGDVYISAERAERQSHEYRVSLMDEVKRLIIHGILHLVGYDHERSDEDEEIMLQKEDELWDRISV
ncbi:MAG: rRNA maturation RNase YbeY [Spirochaetes bacterium]|nr:rRNA maturation RNase YbeY [Spirochaetota bacterium]